MRQSSVKSWQENAAARLDVLAKGPSGQSSEAAEEGSDEDFSPVGDDSIDVGDGGPTITDIEAELEMLRAKLIEEQQSIDEVRTLRANRRMIDDVVVHARQRSSAGNEKPSFFLTGVACDDAAAEGNKQLSLTERYPHLQHERKLAKDEALSDKIARLKGGSADDAGKGSKKAQRGAAGPEITPTSRALGGKPEKKPTLGPTLQRGGKPTGPERTLPMLRGPGAKAKSR